MAEPWLKLYAGFLTNPKIMSLPGDVFKVWACCLAQARLHGSHGSLPPVAHMAFAFHIPVDRLQGYLRTLEDHNLIDVHGGSYRVHDWDEWQRPYPSQKPEAVAARVRRHRAQSSRESYGHLVTSSNEGNDVTSVATKRNGRNDVTHVTEPESLVAQWFVEQGIPVISASLPPTPPSLSPVVLDNSLKVESEETEDTGPEKGVKRERPGRRIPANFAMSESMLTYAHEQGLTDDQAAKHLAAFKRWFEQTTKNPTSRDWEKRWMSAVERDIQEGRIRNTPPSRAQEPVSTGVEELTPAEKSFNEMVEALGDDDAQAAVSAETAAIVDVLGGWTAIEMDPPRFPRWVGARARAGGGFGANA